MAWQPIEMREERPIGSPRVRRLVSLIAMLVTGLTLVYAGYWCIDVGLSAIEDARRLEPVVRPGGKRLTGGPWPFIIGAGLLALGFLTLFAAVVPSNWLDCLRRKPPVTGDLSATHTRSHRWFW